MNIFKVKALLTPIFLPLSRLNPNCEKENVVERTPLQ